MTGSFFDIILFAMVAAFLVLRLRSVLGRRTGLEQHRDPFVQPRPTAPQNVVALPDRSKLGETQAGALGPGIAQIRAADAGFDPDAFLEGARTAFEMIVAAFAAGDRLQLRPLLSDEVYARFAEAIHARNQARETQETKIAAIKSVEIVEAGVEGNTAQVTVKFVSDQVNVTRSAEGGVVEGDPEKVDEKTDFWTFARNTRSLDPNWHLVATQSG
jgi:predicted lipid-binding transport protein (Tim44 family)